MNDSTAAQLPEIIRDFPRVAPEVVKQASQYAASILADVAGRRGTLDGRIAPLTPSTRLAGTAFTVEVRAGDNLMIHAAMQIAKPGDVLVIDGKGDTSCALMGSIMVNACVQLGIAGIVIDAAVRDSEEIVEMGYPVYSVGTNPNGPTASRRPRGGRCRRGHDHRAREGAVPSRGGGEESRRGAGSHRGAQAGQGSAARLGHEDAAGRRGAEGGRIALRAEPQATGSSVTRSAFSAALPETASLAVSSDRSL